MKENNIRTQVGQHPGKVGQHARNLHYPKIIQFLGYVPFEIDTSTLDGQIKLYRYLNGLTQKELAQTLQINESTVFHYEKNTHKPSTKTMKRLKLIDGAFANFKEISEVSAVDPTRVKLIAKGGG